MSAKGVEFAALTPGHLAAHFKKIEKPLDPVVYYGV